MDIGKRTKVLHMKTRKQMYCSFKVQYIGPLSPFVSLSLFLKPCFSGQKLERQLRLCKMKVMINFTLWKCTSGGNCDYCTCYAVKIHPLLCLWLRNSTKHNRAKFNIYRNHGRNETKIQKPQILRGKYQVVFMAKTIRFLSRNQQILSSSMIITKGKI